MALFQSTRILPNQRLDLEDYRRIEEFVCSDFSAMHKFLWANGNYVMSGFEATAEGSGILAISQAEAVVLLGADKGKMLIGAPSLEPLRSSSLTANSVNYVELKLQYTTGANDNRAFWDETASGGAGAEFSQTVDTVNFLSGELVINTSNFSGDADKIPLCTVTTDGNGDFVQTAILDRRPMFFRLGRPGNGDYSYTWPNQRNAETNTTDYGISDKAIGSMKDMLDAFMTKIKELGGTRYWYEPANVGTAQTYQNLGLSVLTGANASARFIWSGTQLQITDDAGVSPTDVVGRIRLLNSTASLSLTRQDISTDPISIADGEVLWVEIPNPVSSITYNGIGASAAQYRVSPLGSIPLQDNVYWLAVREGTRLYLRGLGDLEAGEAQQINDTMSLNLSARLGFDAENATSIPYSHLPSSLLWSTVFTNSDDIATAIGVNATNIDIIGTMLQENAYDEEYTIVSGVPSGNYELGPITAGDIVTLPVDSRDGDSVQQYVVGDGVLDVYLDGVLLSAGRDYLEIGTPGALSSTIQMLNDVNVEEYLRFCMKALGGFSVGGSGGGGDVTGAANVGGGEGELFRDKSAGTLNFRTLKAGAGISIVMNGDQIIISTTGGAPTPYYRNDLTGQIGTSVNTGNPYNLGENKLDVYRNGVLMLNQVSSGLGDPDLALKYQEATDTSIVIADPLTAVEIMSFVNQDTTPTSRVEITGVSGSTLTVPSYTLGNDSLRVFRNGVLMNPDAVGSAADQYTEATATTITLADPATTDEWFTVIAGPIPTMNQTFTGLTGTVITFPSSYPQGSGELLLYRNGQLMYNSTTLGAPVERYQETTTNSITLAQNAVATEWFTAIIK